jgi:hypothetical protein
VLSNVTVTMLRYVEGWYSRHNRGVVTRQVVGYTIPLHGSVTETMKALQQLLIRKLCKPAVARTTTRLFPPQATACVTPDPGDIKG